MHTSNFGDWIVHHNGGYDGDAIFVKHKPDRKPHEDSAPEVEVKIPMGLILHLAADVVRAARTERLEQQQSHEILGVDPHLLRID